ncbi:hypothetical protein HZA57_08130, partial [Candidatus Poribacteria bacterium]|nr:hypothetical protein [Candidatus Poribacteria bacterium]
MPLTSILEGIMGQFSFRRGKVRVLSVLVIGASFLPGLVRDADATE